MSIMVWLLNYSTVGEVSVLVTQLGTGALLAKVDIEATYWLIPVYPQDHPLQEMKWEGKIYVDPMLPFDLHLVPKIY